MLKIAEKRAASSQAKIDFIAAICWICPKQGNDLSRAIWTSICYMQDEVEVGDALRRWYALNEDGVLSLMCIRPNRADEVFPGYSYS